MNYDTRAVIFRFGGKVSVDWAFVELYFMIIFARIRAPTQLRRQPNPRQLSAHSEPFPTALPLILPDRPLLHFCRHPNLPMPSNET